MTQSIRRADDRGHARFDWLESRHTFSFGEYRDPAFMGFRALRVINEDRVAPGAGFAPHGHRDMEILSYVVEGALEHADDLGNGSVVRPGEIQLMHAGTGIRHSEMNPSPNAPLHFLQIWIEPDGRGHAPGYAQTFFPPEARRGVWCPIVTPDGANDTIPVNQDARAFATLLDRGEHVHHALAPGRGAWLQLVRGEIAVDAVQLRAGDGLAVTDVDALDCVALADAEALLFDLA